jgi:hypothetical protein
MYPPIAADSHCVTISQIAPEMANVVADAPRFAHGEIVANPRPAPSANSMIDVATATAAPAMMAPHETAVPARRR